MKKGATIFLQVVLVLIGLGAAALLIIEPQREGVNAHATNFEIYFKDPFLALVYAGSIPFFIGVYKAFQILGYARANKIFSVAAVQAVRTIKRCAMVVIGFVVAEEIWIMFTHGNDDATGGFAMGVIITLGSVIVIAAAAVLERNLQKAVEIKTENELTV